MRLISFYTKDTPYEAEADKLRNSCLMLGLSVEILGVPDRGSWDANHKWKPFVIKRALNTGDDDVLFVDADATLHGVPEIDGEGCDFGVHIMDKAYWGQDTKRRNFSLMSGTLWFPNTDKARDILTAWEDENELEPKRWGQKNLEKVVSFNPQLGVCDDGYRMLMLSERWCAIDKTMWGIDDAIVRHHQASRRLRGGIGR